MPVILRRPLLQGLLDRLSLDHIFVGEDLIPILIEYGPPFGIQLGLLHGLVSRGVDYRPCDIGTSLVVTIRLLLPLDDGITLLIK